MANERLSMRKTQEILRLKWELGRSHREVAASQGVGLGTVSQALERAIAAELGWPAVAAMSETELDRRLYRRKEVPPGDRPLPDFVYLHASAALRRDRHDPALLDRRSQSCGPTAIRHSTSAARRYLLAAPPVAHGVANIAHAARRAGGWATQEEGSCYPRRSF